MTKQAQTAVRFYLRVSTDEQAQHGTSLDSQEEILSRAAELRSWRVADVYSDGGVSGAKSARPALDRLFRDVQPGEIVAVASIDRLARKLSLLLNLIDELEDQDVSFFSAREDWDTSTPMGKFAVQMVGAAAELERELITERTRLGRLRRAREGKWPSGKPPFGLKMGDSGILEQVPEQAAAVKLIFDVFISERMGLLQLRNRLHDLGVPTASGKMWWKDSAVYKVLTNPVYAGKHANGAVAPPVVKQQVFERVQKQLKANNRFRPRVSGRQWPLQGRIKCAECATGWRVNINHGVRSYFCPGRERNSRYFERTGNLCTVPRINADELELLIWNKFRNTLSDPNEFLRTLDDSIRRLELRLADLETGIGPAQRDLEEANGALSKLAKKFVVTSLTESEFEQLRVEIEERREVALARIDALGPELKVELEGTRRDLQGAHDWRDTVTYRIKEGLGMGGFSLDPDLAESEAMQEFRDSGGHPLAGVDDKAIPKALTQVLDSIQADVIAYQDHFEVRGLVDMDVSSADSEISDPLSPTPSRGLG